MKYFITIGLALLLAGCPHHPSRKSLNTASELSDNNSYDGKSFYEQCGDTKTDTAESQREDDVCVWYITNVTLHPDVKKVTCFPQRPSARERHNLVVNYLKNNPQKHHLTAREIIIEAMNASYPCT